MIDPHRQLEREEEALEKELAEGWISNDEYNSQLRELHLDYRDAAEGAAWDAYNDERDRW